MITLGNFLQLAMDDYYTINIYFIDEEAELIHQAEVREIEEKLEELGKSYLMFEAVASWDLGSRNELTINI
jgi:hypothetical protein